MDAKKFTKDVVKEAKRVRWPKRDVLVPAIVVTVIIVALFGLLLWFEDIAGNHLLQILRDWFESMR
jgi:preprotein translocase SecE subunit